MSYIIVTLLIKIMIFWENGTFAIDKFNVILELTNYFIKLIKKYKVNNKSKGKIFYLMVKLPNIQFACI